MSEEKKEETLSREELEALIDETLDKIRPYIQHDGGDIELLGVDEASIAYVSFRGACAGCIMAADDFAGGIKMLLLDEIPALRDVVLI
jgi:Fe-S cluster biogenesis protein NfuA